MTKVDQFESAFRSAAKAVYTHRPWEVRSILVITDLEPFPAEQFARSVEAFLSVLAADPPPAWRHVHGGEFQTVRDLLDLVESARPDLICTYRHLHSSSWRWPFTLGEHLEVLTQATTTPVLVAPHPRSTRAAGHVLDDTGTVMAMTDHLTGDDRLVSVASRLTAPGGALLLTHVEDLATLERYLETISKIPEIDTELARARIEAQLLKEPRDYIRSCRAGLEAQDLKIEVRSVVTLGRRLSEYRKLIEDHEVDLLVLNTKDEEQHAMHGLAHPLAVEVREIPLLLL